MYRHFSSPLVFCLIALLALTGCRKGEVPVGPGTTFDAPSAQAIMLPPPTAAQQVNQGDKPWCAPAAGLTLYRMIVGKNMALSQAAKEMGTTSEGTYTSELVKWLNDHEMTASSTYIPFSGAIGMITDQIKRGNYVLPHVNESAKLNSPHVFIVYGVDRDRILISDSNTRLGMNRIGVKTDIFRDRWLIKLGTEQDPVVLLSFVYSKKKRSTTSPQKAEAVGSVESPYDNLPVK